MREDKITRRKFVASTGGAAVGAMIVPRKVLGGPGYTAPSDTVNVAVVGCGGQGATNAAELVDGGQNIVALADVDFGFVDQAITRRMKNRDGSANQKFIKLQEAYGKAKRHADFRKMLEAHKDVDGVIVATPDHTHAVIAKAAMELGKHVYVEKPLTYTVQEARMLRDVARRTKVVTQMGNMGHSNDTARLVNEWIQAGVLGQIKEVHVWTNRPIWPQGVPRPGKSAAAAAGPQDQMATALALPENWTTRGVSKGFAAAMAGNFSAPSGLDWDLFLGPAPDVPYHPIYHPFNWRGWSDWGTGAIGDMAAHLIDHPYWALGLTYPTSVEATSTPWGMDSDNKPASFPLSTRVTYRFPARGAQPPVTIYWSDGGLMPARPDLLPDDVPLERGGGVIYIGEKGILMHETYGTKPRLFPESLKEVAEKVPQTYPRIETNDDPQKSPKHRMNWAKTIMGKDKASSPFDYAGPLTETMLLGVVAMRAGQGKKVYYDGETGRITNPTDANQYLHREYRKGWTL